MTLGNIFATQYRIWIFTGYYDTTDLLIWVKLALDFAEWYWHLILQLRYGLNSKKIPVV